MIFSSHGGDINILAFFQVVASGQISPHFRGAKVVKFFDLQTFSEKNILRISPLSPFGRNRRTRLSYSERNENIKVLLMLYNTVKI